MKSAFFHFLMPLSFLWCMPFLLSGQIKLPYEVVYEDGIYFEKFDSTNTDENRYTANNVTYLEGNVLTYSYYYEDTNGRRFKFKEFKRADGKLDWDWVPADSSDANTVASVVLTVCPGLKPMVYSVPDYNQTVILFEYPRVNGEKEGTSYTGAVDNEKNVWIHPPRDKFFRILEINPFPYIQAPYKVGTRWEWWLDIGSYWGDVRWKTWEGVIRNNYRYEITGETVINTALGPLDCFVVESTAESTIGKTYLKSWFSPVFGFVRMAYINIDGSKTVLELVQFEKKL